MRVKHSVALVISDDASAKVKVFDHQDEQATQTQTDAFKHSNNGILTISPGATEDLPFGDVVDGRGLYLESTGDCNVAVNGGAARAMKIDPAGGAAAKARMLTEESLASATIENPAGATADIKVIYAVWGDLA